VRGPTSVPIFDNASEALIKGAEFERTVAPMKGLDISLGVPFWTASTRTTSPADGAGVHLQRGCVLSAQYGG